MSTYTFGIGSYRESIEADSDEDALACASKHMREAAAGSDLRKEIDAGSKAAVWSGEQTIGFVTE